MLAITGDFTFAAVPAAITPNSLVTDNASWFWQNPLPQGNLLNGLECRTISAADHCLAVGLSSKVNFVLGGQCGASGPNLTLTYSGAGPEVTSSRGVTIVGLRFQYTGTGAAAIKSLAGGGNGGNSLYCVKVSA